MSFEGTYQVLCKNGHSDMFDVYSSEAEDWICSECGEPAVWYNIIDETNGISDNYVELEILVEPKECTCPTCGHKHSSGVAVYKIPEFSRHKVRK